MFFLCALAACQELGNGKDPKIPGDLLGGYHVIGELEQSSCGPGALGSTDIWEFDVRLSRDARDLYWLNGREAILGYIAADDVSFRFDTRVATELSPSRPGRPGCSIVRVDQASGTLAAAGLDVPSFDGRIRFGYFAATPEVDCSGLVGVPGGLAALPCELTYGLDGLRTHTAEDLALPAATAE
jgi:hypothetical protein